MRRAAVRCLGNNAAVCRSQTWPVHARASLWRSTGTRQLRSSRSTRDGALQHRSRSLGRGKPREALLGTHCLGESTTAHRTQDHAAAERHEDGWAVSRLEVRCAALAAENDSLRACLTDVTDNNAALHAALAAREQALARAERGGAQEAAQQRAEVEHQVSRYKQMLHELARSAETLSRDNVVLSTEVVQLRVRCQDARDEGSVMEARVGHLQVRRQPPL